MSEGARKRERGRRVKRERYDRGDAVEGWERDVTDGQELLVT